MTMTAFVETDVRVDCIHLADGKIVRLTGALGPDDIDDLRKLPIRLVPRGNVVEP